MLCTNNRESESGWVSREVEALISAWGRGTDATAFDVLDGRAEIDTESAIRLVYEEACMRREAGQNVKTDEVVKRFPRWAPELRDL